MKSKHKRYLLIFIPLLIISIGFAYLSASLGIFGNFSAKAPSWEIYFTNFRTTKGSVSAQDPIIDNNNHTITYSADLQLPGEYYEFKIDIVNDGTIDAMINSFDNQVSEGIPSYIEYTATYLDGGPIKEKQYLKAGETVTLLVRAKVQDDIEETVSTEEDVDLTTTLSMQYIKADENAIEREKGTHCDNQVKRKSATCRRATTLHTETCMWGDLHSEYGGNVQEYGCYQNGYYKLTDYQVPQDPSLSKDTRTIIYGNCGNSGTLTPGDAFTCDVNGDGKFDEDNERFYYVSPKDADESSDKVTLIYAHNIKNKEIVKYKSNSDSAKIRFSGKMQLFRDGYDTLAEEIPTTSEWSKVSISDTYRNLQDKDGNVAAQFNISSYNLAARPMTYNELKYACPEASEESNSIKTCDFLLEDTNYANTTNGGDQSSRRYWLETLTDTNQQRVYTVAAIFNSITETNTSESEIFKPVIEVSKSKIDY